MSELKKKCTVVMLPTEKRAADIKSISLSLNSKSKLIYTQGSCSEAKAQHLYICSTDEIPYNANGGTNGLFVCLSELDHPEDAIVKNVGNCPACRRIIATTDSSLKIRQDVSENKGYYQDLCLPTVSDAFIQAFIKAYNEGKPITEVMVEYHEVWDHTKPILYSDDYDTKIVLKLRGNEIIITKVKDTWNRDEVIEIIKKFDTDSTVGHFNGPDTRNNWIKQNL